MREDMFKVIVERPRWGSRHAPKAKLRNDKVPGRKRATGRRQALEQHGYTKCLNENLAPLKRYLMKQVGRPWDKVYSEISEHLDTGSTVKQHVRDHLTDFILINVSVDRDGGFMATRHWGGPQPPHLWWAKLYVDPNDGIIKRTDKLCRKLGVKDYRGKNPRRSQTPRAGLALRSQFAGPDRHAGSGEAERLLVSDRHRRGANRQVRARPLWPRSCRGADQRQLR